MIRIIKKENNFVQIDKGCLNDARLSWKAKGLLCYLLSLPDNWKIYIEDLKTRSADGRDSTASGIKELIEFGYCTREQLTDERGRKSGYAYNIYETPVNIEVAPETEKPFTDIPVTGKPKPIINKKNNNKYNNNQSISQEVDGTTDNFDYVFDAIKSQIDYDTIISQPRWNEIRGNELYKIMVMMADVMMCKEEYIYIAKEEKPTSLVRSVFKRIGFDEIINVLNKNLVDLASNPIKNKKEYLKTTLFNSVME